MILILPIVSCFPTIITGSFKVCDTQNRNFVRTDDTVCFEKEKSYPSNISKIILNNSYLKVYENKEKNPKGYGSKTKNNKYEIIFDLYTKLENKISGFGYQCIKTKTTHAFWTYWYGGRDFPVNTVHDRLSLSNCEEMIRTRECGPNKFLTCSDEYCKFSETIIPEYSYFYKIIKESVHCVTIPKMIVAKEENSHIFNSKCTPLDFKCELDDSIIIWNKNIIHQCPYVRLKEKIKFEVNPETLNLRNIENHWGLRIKKQVKACHDTS